MISQGQRHWDAVYAEKTADQVSWYRPHLERSLCFLDNAKIERTAAILDVGGGASTFVDDLVDRGFSNVTLLDLSQTALDLGATRLGDRASAVKWICADVTQADLPDDAYDFWHDRAVFHFLTDPRDRSRYVATARKALRPGGHILIATFGPHGPEKCSGLEVMRYTPDTLHRAFGDDFTKIGDATEIHSTPWGAEQEFVYCYCRIPMPNLLMKADTEWEAAHG